LKVDITNYESGEERQKKIQPQFEALKSTIAMER
jgi:hypothetical protein